MQITPGIGSTTESDCVCAENSFMCGDRGCIPCPAGLHCPEGLGPPRQQGGYWADPNISNLCDFSVLRCRDEFECPAGVLGSCSSGREGQACNNCQPRHYPRGSICEDCSDGDALPVLLLTLLLLCVLFFFSGSRWDPSQVSSQFALRCLAALEGLLNFFCKKICFFLIMISLSPCLPLLSKPRCSTVLSRCPPLVFELLALSFICVAH